MAIQGTSGASTRTTEAPTKIHPLDDLENWGKEFTFTPPLPKHEIEEWQKRFDRVFPRNRRGESVFKLVWSGDRRYWLRFFYDWDAYGKGTKVEERPLVLWKKVDVGDGFYVDLFPPRWLILSRVEPEQYAENWKRESWVWDGKRKQNKQIRDDEPPKDFWQVWGVIGEHDRFCCEVAGSECFGSFRQPGDKDLDLLRNLYREFQAGHQSPYEELNSKTEAEIASYCREYYRQQYTAMAGSSEIIVEHAADFLAPLADFSGQTYTDREKKEIVKDAFDRFINERAENYDKTLRGE